MLSGAKRAERRWAVGPVIGRCLGVGCGAGVGVGGVWGLCDRDAGGGVWGAGFDDAERVERGGVWGGLDCCGGVCALSLLLGERLRSGLVCGGGEDFGGLRVYW